MKPRILHLFIPIVALMLAACESGIIDNAVLTQNYVEPEYSVGVSKTTFEVANDGGELSLEVYVSNNLPWQATTTDSWVTLSQTSGKGNATIKLTVLANETGEVRQATVTIKAREKSASVTITQEGAKETPDEEIDGHAYVNLGLPSGLLWATCNVGADNPEDYGGYFAWGETTTKSTYNWSTYKWCNGSETTLTKYNTKSSYGTVDNKTVLDLSDDAARANWGGGWRMATKDEWQELKDNCIWTWTNQGGHNGYKVTSKSNGNSIFLPAAGSHRDSDLYYAGVDGDYWSSSLGTDLLDIAWGVGFNSGDVGAWSGSGRDCGRSVRPVWKEEAEPYFEVSPSDFSFGSAGGTSSLTINSNRVWNVSTEASWLTLSTSSGNGNGMVSVTASENTSTDSRTGTVTFTAGGKSYLVSVTQEGAEQQYEEIDGHAYVNLGLPSGLLWATCNVGADNPEDYGGYFAWGETTTKTTYDWSTYKWCNGSNTSLTKYNTKSSYGTVDNKTVLDLEDDAAHVNWGGSWRMPTDDEWTELRNNCTWTWTSQGGHNGDKVTSKSNGNSIFLPAAGYRWDLDLNYAGENGDYLSSSLNADYPFRPLNAYFYSGNVAESDGRRDCGYSVRPVCRP